MCAYPPELIKKMALEAGFDACGIARAEALPEDAVYLRKWLDKGFHGDMSYLERNFDKRTDPRLLVPGCKSIVVVALNYYTAKKQPAGAPKVAKYAFPEIDYHTTLKAKLSELERMIIAEYGENSVNKNVQHLFVDSAPVLERRWAERAGLGWIGKNTMLINPHFGSFIYLGVLMLNIDMSHYDSPIDNRCRICDRCVEACPNKALSASSVNSRQCISYNTNTYKGEIPASLNLNNYLAGCDICNDVCPWNKKSASENNHSELYPHPFIINARQDDWDKLDMDNFKQIFRKSALSRINFLNVKKKRRKQKE